MNPRANAAIVSTVRNAAATIDSFVAYHLAVGFSRIFLFFDDPGDPDLVRFSAHPMVTAIAHDFALRSAWSRMPEYGVYGTFIDREVMARQVLNVAVAMDLARQMKLDWLLHIDSDELFYCPASSAADHFALIDPRVHAVTYPNYEAIPERTDISDAFREVDLFKPPPGFGPQITPQGLAFVQAIPQLPPNLFHFYANGKSAVNLAFPELRPMDVHEFAYAGGQTLYLRSTAAFVLHYACCGFEAFWEKYRCLGQFSDLWWGKTDIRSSIGSLHLDARDAVAKGDRDEAADFFRRRIAIEDPRCVRGLIDHGIAVRIPEPRWLLENLVASPARGS